jgi:phage tail-like protein
MSSRQRDNPLLTFRFQVEIDNVIEAGFSECSGLQVETEFEEVREGGVNGYVYKLPKGSKYVNLTLKRGMTNSDSLWQWHKDVVNGKIKRKTVRVLMSDTEGRQWSWTFEGAYPVKWTGPEMKADASTVAIETLELAHHKFDAKIT